MKVSLKEITYQAFKVSGLSPASNNLIYYKIRHKVDKKGEGEDIMQKLKVKNGMVGEGVKFERIRRVTGYLVGTVDRFNNAKKAEEKDRVKHAHLK